MGIGELAHIHDSFTSTVRVSPSRGQVVEGQGVRALRATSKGVGRHHRHSGLAYEVGRLGARLIGPFFLSSWAHQRKSREYLIIPKNE
jgi:hypothetical protein